MYRQRAKDLLAQAALSTNEKIKEDLSGIAESYLQLALMIERQANLPKPEI